eukprot:403357055
MLNTYQAAYINSKILPIGFRFVLEEELVQRFQYLSKRNKNKKGSTGKGSNKKTKNYNEDPSYTSKSRRQSSSGQSVSSSSLAERAKLKTLTQKIISSHASNKSSNQKKPQQQPVNKSKVLRDQSDSSDGEDDLVDDESESEKKGGNNEDSEEEDDESLVDSNSDKDSDDEIVNKSSKNKKKVQASNGFKKQVPQQQKITQTIAKNVSNNQTKIKSEVQKNCLKIVNLLKKEDRFHNIPAFLDRFSNIEKKIASQQYTSLSQFKTEMIGSFNQLIQINSGNTDLINLCQEALKKFDTIYDVLTCDQNLSQNATETHSQSQLKHLEKTVQSLTKNSKGQFSSKNGTTKNDGSCVPPQSISRSKKTQGPDALMTTEEQTALTQLIGTLKAEDQIGIYEIIKNGPGVEVVNGELQFSISSLPAITQRNLERYVKGKLQKSRPKKKPNLNQPVQNNMNPQNMNPQQNNLNRQFPQPQLPPPRQTAQALMQPYRNFQNQQPSSNFPINPPIPNNNPQDLSKKILSDSDSDSDSSDSSDDENLKRGLQTTDTSFNPNSITAANSSINPQLQNNIQNASNNNQYQSRSFHDIWRRNVQQQQQQQLQNQQMQQQQSNNSSTNNAT